MIAIVSDNASESVSARSTSRSGLVLAISAYAIWGVFPAYFLTLRPAGAFEVVGWRVLFALVFCAIILTVTRTWRRLGAVARRPRSLLTMGVAGILIFVNWSVYLYGVLSGHVVESALGYFINPIVTVFLGVVVLHERLRKLQWAAVGISVVAVIVIAVGYGAVPWIALVLAASFGLYGLVKKRVGANVDAVSGLTLETAWVSPLAIVALVYIANTSGLVFGTAGALNTLAIAGAGVMTAVPLLLFAAAASRLPLSHIGFIQYMTPILQFVYGVFILHEPMPPERLAGFALVWLALAFLSYDAVSAGRRSRRLTMEPAP